MNERTQEQLDRLTTYRWFEQVGQPCDGNVLPVASWQEAVRLATGDVWSSVQLQVRNHLASEVNRRNWDRYAQWSQIAPKLRTGIRAITDEQIRPVARQLGLSDGFLHAVEWDMTFMCLEAEYADVYPPHFFIPQLSRWYEAGHFPCGWSGPLLDTNWNGELPAAQLYVY